MHVGGWEAATLLFESICQTCYASGIGAQVACGVLGETNTVPYRRHILPTVAQPAALTTESAPAAVYAAVRAVASTEAARFAASAATALRYVNTMWRGRPSGRATSQPRRADLG